MRTAFARRSVSYQRTRIGATVTRQGFTASSLRPRRGRRKVGRFGPGPVYALSIAISVWLLYLAVKVAQHVNAWPF